jgi:transposase
MGKQTKSVTLTENQRSALQAICRRRKVDALVWKRARAFLLLDAGYDAKTICEILDIGPTVLTEWRFAFAGMGLSFFGLKDYSQRQGHLSSEQERATQAHFTGHSARNADEICAYILAEYGQSYDLPPEAPSFITRVCGFGFHIRWFQFQQAGRVRSPQIVQVLDVLQRVFGFQVMSAV